jgi:DNA-binding MarR family transcriptional regulator
MPLTKLPPNLPSPPRPSSKRPAPHAVRAIAPDAAQAGSVDLTIAAAVEAALTRFFRLATRPKLHRSLARSSGAPLDRAAYATLLRIEESAPVRLTELASHLGTDISTSSRQVRGLESSGLVQRVSDPTDHRASRLSLTREGRRVVKRSQTARREMMGTLLSDWPADERAELARLLNKLADAIAGLDDQGTTELAVIEGRA